MAWVNNEADESAETGAIQDGVEVYEMNGGRCLDTGTKVCAANRDAAAFHDGVEELVDVEEISEEDNKRKRLLGFKEPKVAGTEWSVLFEVRISSTVYGAVAECQVWITARSVF